LNKILAVSIGGLGDTILFSPLLKALRKSYPRSHIELLVANRLAQETYSNAKEVSHVTFVNFNRSSPLLKAISLIPFIFSARLNGEFDIGFFATGLNHKLGQLMKTVGIVHDIACAPYVPSCPTDFDCNLELARSVDDTIGEQDVFIPESEEAELETKNILKEHNLSLKDENLLAVYPSMDLKHRPRWGLSKLIKVIQLIKKDGFNGETVVVGSQSEGEEWAAIDKENIVDANLAGKLSILGSASLLGKCSLTIANDGGLMHVAGAAGRPLVAIMPNAAMTYRPPGENTVMIQSNLPCSGCYPKRPKDCYLADCTEDITVEKVFQACQELLKENAKSFS
jgi:ADP-heptose:LPS heptosyltransferase